jgi:hypothetical protein
MAEINWGALQTPDFAGNALRYRRAGEEDGRETATRNALKGYGTNPDGAIQDLMGVNPDMALELKARQQKEQERQSRITGAQAYAKRDFDGARQAYAGIGDMDGVSAADDAQSASAKRVADEAQFMMGLLKEKGPDAVLSAFDQRSGSYGASQEQLDMIRAKIAENPEQALTALAGAPTYKYQRGTNGEIVAVNEATGETEVVREDPLLAERRDALVAQAEAARGRAGQSGAQAAYYGAKARQPYAPQRPRAGASNKPPSGFILD